MVLQSQSGILPSASMTFFTNWLKLFSSRSQCSSLIRMKGRSFSQKYLSIVGSLAAPVGSYYNELYGKCLKWAAQSKMDFTLCWKSCLNLLQILSAKVRSSPRFFWKKLLNSAQVTRASFAERRLCWGYCWATTAYKNKAAKRTRLGPLALAVSKWFSHYWQK